MGLGNRIPSLWLFGSGLGYFWWLIITDRFPVVRFEQKAPTDVNSPVVQDEVPPELTRMPLVPCPLQGNRLENFGGDAFEQIEMASI